MSCGRHLHQTHLHLNHFLFSQDVASLILKTLLVLVFEPMAVSVMILRGIIILILSVLEFGSLQIQVCYPSVTLASAFLTPV